LFLDMHCTYLAKRSYFSLALDFSYWLFATTPEGPWN
jgi:hypothetical protein